MAKNVMYLWQQRRNKLKNYINMWTDQMRHIDACSPCMRMRMHILIDGWTAEEWKWSVRKKNALWKCEMRRSRLVAIDVEYWKMMMLAAFSGLPSFESVVVAWKIVNCDDSTGLKDDCSRCVNGMYGYGADHVYHAIYTGTYTVVQMNEYTWITNLWSIVGCA